jgi:hypothetical protein
VIEDQPKLRHGLRQPNDRRQVVVVDHQIDPQTGVGDDLGAAAHVRSVHPRRVGFVLQQVS